MCVMQESEPLPFVARSWRKGRGRECAPERGSCARRSAGDGRMKSGRGTLKGDSEKKRKDCRGIMRVIIIIKIIIIIRFY